MLKNRSLSVAVIVAVLGVFMARVHARAADAPKVSTFAPAEDLARQADKYIETMKSTVASEEEYNDSEGKIGRDSNTLVVIALALGLHDQNNKYKARAGALMKAAQVVAATKDYAAANKSFFQVAYGYSYPRWQAEATYQSGRCFEAWGKRAEALTQYREVIEKFPATDQASPAKKRIEELAK